jgi:hypothetical protein
MAKRLNRLARPPCGASAKVRLSPAELEKQPAGARLPQAQRQAPAEIQKKFRGGERITSDQLKPHYCAERDPVAVSTTTAPLMCGCTEQKYSYVPAVVKVKENFSAVSSAFDLNSWVLEVTVCGVSSWLIQVTVVPAFMVMRCGLKLNWSITISVPAACAEKASKLAAASVAATTTLLLLFVLMSKISGLKLAAARPLSRAVAGLV